MSAWLLAAIGLRWVVTAGTLVGAGGVLFLASRIAVAPERAAPPGGVALGRTARLGTVAAGVAAFAMLVGLALDVPSGASPGAAWWIRLTGLALIATLPRFVHPVPWIPLVGVALVAVSFAMSGHGTHEPRWLMSPLVVAHVTLAGFWVGALWPLYRLAGEPSDRARAASAAERFGRRAVWAVAALIAAGSTLAALLLGSVEALFATSYGRVLLAKLALVAALLALAALNRWRLVPALSSPDEAIATVAAGRLRRSLRFEAILVLGIVLATAVLTSATRLTHAH